MGNWQSWGFLSPLPNTVYLLLHIVRRAIYLSKRYKHTTQFKSLKLCLIGVFTE